MARLITFIILAFVGSKLFSQQCGYENYYLFVVYPHSQNSLQGIPDLKMYLVDENEAPIRVAVTYEDQKQWKTRSDTLFFWDNKRNFRDYGPPLHRRKYYNISDHYVVAFRLEINDLKDPFNHPIYNVKIEGGYDPVSLDSFPTQLFYLPVSKAIRICDNGVLRDDQYSQPVKTLDGNAFEPIDIIIDRPQAYEATVEEENERLKYTVRFDYQAVDDHNEGVATYAVKSARIYDTGNGKLHQEIYIPSQLKSINKESKNVTEFADYYNRNLTEAQDFSVQIDSWRDLEFMVFRKKTNFYIFDSAMKRYELDTALSNYSDVFYYKPLKKMRRYDYTRTPASKISLTYEFNNKQWELIDRSESLFKPAPPAIKYSPKACILFNEQSHTLPLKAVVGTNANGLVKDTFWLYNACDDTVFIIKVQSPTRDFFSINQTLFPKQKTPLIFNGIIKNSSFDFTTNQYSCNVTLADSTMLIFNITVPVVGNNVSVFYNKDSTISHATGKHENKRYTIAVLTFPNGNLRAEGLVLDGDTTLKAGTWRYFKDGAWGIDEEVYSKAISLSAFEENYGGRHADFKINVLEKGKWKQPITEINNNEQRFFINPATDSIIAFTDTTSYTFALSYKELPGQISRQLYLLKPNQRSLKIGNYTMPFNTIEDSYTLIPNYLVLKSNFKTTYQITDSLINKLQKTYPKLKEVFVSKNQRGISLSDLSEVEKKQMLLQLEKDSSIGFVCKLFTIANSQRLGYCNNLVYFEANKDKLEEIRKTVLDLGFTDIKEDVGHNRFLLTYKSKIIDEGFFEAFKKLTENRFVVAAFFNTYIEAEPDVDFKRH